MKATLINTKKSYHKQYWTQLSTTSNLVFINTCLRSDMFIVGWLLASRGAATDWGGGARSKPLACGWQFLVRWHKLITVSIKVIKTCKKVYIVWFSGNHYQTKFDLGSYSRSLRMRKQQSKRIWKFHSVQKSSQMKNLPKKKKICTAWSCHLWARAYMTRTSQENGTCIYLSDSDNLTILKIQLPPKLVFKVLSSLDIILIQSALRQLSWAPLNSFVHQHPTQSGTQYHFFKQVSKVI